MRQGTVPRSLLERAVRLAGAPNTPATRRIVEWALTRDDEEKWITVNGTHIKVGEGGKPVSGPTRLKKALGEKRENQISEPENSLNASVSSQNRLQNIAKSCNIIASDGVQIRGYSSHILDQMEARGFNEADVEEAVTKPMHISPDKIDKDEVQRAREALPDCKIETEVF